MTTTERKTSASTAYYAVEPEVRDPAAAYWHHRRVALRVLAETKHRRWGHPAVAVAIAQVHAELATGSAMMALARRNGGGS